MYEINLCLICKLKRQLHFYRLKNPFYLFAVSWFERLISVFTDILMYISSTPCQAMHHVKQKAKGVLLSQNMTIYDYYHVVIFQYKLHMMQLLRYSAMPWTTFLSRSFTTVSNIFLVSKIACYRSLCKYMAFGDLSYQIL